MNQYTLRVDGMSCTGCEERVVNAVKQIEDVHRVEADHESGTVDITAPAETEKTVRQAIHNAGYDLPV